MGLKYIVLGRKYVATSQSLTHCSTHHMLIKTSADFVCLISGLTVPRMSNPRTLALRLLLVTVSAYSSKIGLQHVLKDLTYSCHSPGHWQCW